MTEETTGKKVGRPKGAVSPRGQRGIHMIRAYPDEWEVLQTFIRLVRIDTAKCRAAVKILEPEVK